MWKRLGLYLTPFLLIGCLMAGCGTGNGGNSENGGKGAAASPSVGQTAKTKEPIKLTIVNGEPGALDFEATGLVDVLKAKFPYITFEIIKRGKGSDYPDLIANGTPVDIIYEAASLTAERIMTHNFQFDMQGLIKQHNLDLSRYEPNVLAQTQTSNSEMKFYGVPLNVNKYAMFYNKDLFDKFGVGYPKDGMTWDDVYDLAKTMSRQDGGVPYKGFYVFPNNQFLNNQLSLSPLDPKEDKADVNTAGWKTLFLNYARFFQLPNAQDLPLTTQIPDFSEKGNIAMTVDTNGFVVNVDKVNAQLNWDMVSIPTLKEKPKTGLKPAGLDLFVAQTSKYKDDAMDVIAYLVSDEIQTKLSRKGFGTPLASPTVQKAFAQELPAAKGKNTGALYYYKDAPSPQPRAANLTNITVNFGNAFTDLVKKNMDVNTVLSTFEDNLNKAINNAKDAKNAKK